jgi:hypothetical protein
MVSLDPVLDSANDNQISDFVDADTRNHLAFLELTHYEKTKTFLYNHPILQEYKLEFNLKQLLKSNADKFMKEITNVFNNITRYQSYINSKKFKDQEELIAWQNIIKDCNNKLAIMKGLISA